MDWAKENIQNFDSWKEFHEAFNQKFEQERTFASFQSLCSKRLKLKMGKSSGRFGDGRKKLELPVGTIRKSQTGTYIKVKMGSKNINGYSKPFWKPLQEKIYEEAFGAIGEGEYVIFLDGNTENFSLENLACINRSISVQLAKNRWYSENGEITKTGICYIKLKQAIKERVKEC